MGVDHMSSLFCIVSGTLPGIGYGGDVQFISDSEMYTPGTITSPNLQLKVVVFSKFVPVSVTTVPPDTGPSKGMPLKRFGGLYQ